MTIQTRTNKFLLEEAQTDDFFKIDEHKIKDKLTLRKVLKYANDSNLLDIQREELNEFVTDCLNEGTKPISVLNSITTLKQFSLKIKKPFLEVNKPDIGNYFLDLKLNQSLSPHTIVHKNVHIKHFFTWLYDKHMVEYKDCPPLVKHLSTKVPRKTLHPSDLITKTEVRAMIEACHKGMWKAIISALYESGCRARELTSLKLGDIKFETHSLDISIKHSKTEERTNTLIYAYKYLKDHYNNHPFRDNPNAPLFLNVSNAQYGRALGYQGLVSIVKTAKKRARIKKKVTLHGFRHARATHLALEGWTEAQLREWFGWSKTSNTPTIYVHIANSDVKKKILKQNGLLNEGEAIEDMKERLALEPKICARCGKRNAPDSVVCNCGMALSLASVAEIKNLKQETNGFIEKVNKLPLRSKLIKDEMTPFEYKKKLIQEDPFLREEFKVIAKKVLEKTTLSQVQKVSAQEVISKTPVTNKYKEKIVALRKKGWSMENIKDELGIGYGTVNKICKQKNLTKIY